LATAGAWRGPGNRGVRRYPVAPARQPIFPFEKRAAGNFRSRPIPASLSARRRNPPLPAPQALSAPNCCACNSAARGTGSRPLKSNSDAGHHSHRVQNCT
jgi:hypothetical protein